jgi:hypothetical protein
VASRGRTDDLPLRCAWCGRISRDGRFVEPEEIEAHASKARTSHGICPDCFERELARRSQKKN